MAEKRTARIHEPLLWTIPILGILHGRPINTVPPNAIYDGENVLVRGGLLVNRPGMTQFANSILTGTPLGFFTTPNTATGAFQEDAFQEDAFQLDSSVPSTVLIVATTTNIYIYYGGVFNDITGTILTSGLGYHSRFAAILLGSPLKLNLIHVNGVDPNLKWVTGDATFSVMDGSPPVFSDVANIGDRIVGIVPPYEVRWAPVEDLSTWPALNVRSLAETRDAVVAISSSGLNGGTLYKEYSIWNIVVTGATLDSEALRFDWKVDIDGPASPAAICRGIAAEYYMTKTGRVIKWDGSTIEFPADGVWPHLRGGGVHDHNGDLDANYANRIHSSYEPTNDEYWFFYPRIGDSGAVKGFVVVIPPRPLEGIQTHIAFRGYLNRSITASTDSRLDTKKIILGEDAATAQIFTLEGDDDAGGLEIDGFWQHGISPLPVGPNAARVNEIEPFFERAEGNGEVDVQVVTSNLLDNNTGHVSASRRIDLASVTNVFDIKGVDARGRFAGPRFEFKGPVTIRFKGVELTFLERG